MNNTIKHDVKYEYGAFFKYIDLYKALCDLIPILSSEKIGNNGVYFQRNETEEKKLSKNNSDYEKSTRLKISYPIRSIYYNNYPMILNKDKGRAKKFYYHLSLLLLNIFLIFIYLKNQISLILLIL